MRPIHAPAEKAGVSSETIPVPPRPLPSRTLRGHIPPIVQRTTEENRHERAEPCSHHPRASIRSRAFVAVYSRARPERRSHTRTRHRHRHPSSPPRPPPLPPLQSRRLPIPPPPPLSPLSRSPQPLTHPRSHQ